LSIVAEHFKRRESMKHVMMIVVGIGLAWASAQEGFARGPQGGGSRNMMQMQARHRYGGQSQDMGRGQGQMMGQGRMMGQGQMELQGTDQAIDDTTVGQGNKGNGLQQRKRDRNCQGAATTQMQNRIQQQKRTKARQQDGKGQD
jgi:hypothetical protein